MTQILMCYSGPITIDIKLYICQDLEVSRDDDSNQNEFVGKKSNFLD